MKNVTGRRIVAPVSIIVICPATVLRIGEREGLLCLFLSRVAAIMASPYARTTGTSAILVV